MRWKLLLLPKEQKIFPFYLRLQTQHSMPRRRMKAGKRELNFYSGDFPAPKKRREKHTKKAATTVNRSRRCVSSLGRTQTTPVFPRTQRRRK